MVASKAANAHDGIKRTVSAQGRWDPHTRRGQWRGGLKWPRVADWGASGVSSLLVDPRQGLDVTVRFQPEAFGPHDCTIATGDIRCAAIPCTGFGEV